jgi:sulfatase maturation enzyme AslB (radical SAM superfamily)
MTPIGYYLAAQSDEILHAVELLKAYAISARLRVHINDKSIPSLDSLLERLKNVVNEKIEVYAAPLRSFSHKNQCHDFIERYAGDQIAMTRVVEEKFRKAGIPNKEFIIPRFFHCGAVTESHYVIDFLGTCTSVLWWQEMRGSRFLTYEMRPLFPFSMISWDLTPPTLKSVERAKCFLSVVEDAWFLRKKDVPTT